jgi:hypothetical protein
MSRKLLLLFSAILLVGINWIYGQGKDSQKLVLNPGVLIGYNRGLGLQGNVTALQFREGFPFKLRMGLGLTFLNPGDALDARRIFINNNTNGTPEKKGHSFDLRLDFMLPRRVLGIEESFLYFGPRFSTYTGDFKYVGGNEDFEVRSHQWGLGAGFENHFRMTEKLDLIISYGLDIYAPSTLTGHDTSYSPDNDNVNPRTDNRNDDVYFRYNDANRAIRQPFIMPHLMLGVNLGL